jgi:hypothetical protein
MNSRLSFCTLVDFIIIYIKIFCPDFLKKNSNVIFEFFDKRATWSSSFICPLPGQNFHCTIASKERDNNIKIMFIFSIAATDGSKSILQNATRWDSKCRVMQQEKFSPQGLLRVFIELSGGGGARGWFLFLSLQTTCNSKQTTLRPQPTVMVVNHQQLARLIKPKETVRASFLVIFWFKELQVKLCKSN